MLALLPFLLERANEDDPAFVRASGEEMSYGSLALAVRAVSDMLAQAGPIERRPIGIAVADQAGFLVSALAALASGGVVVPLDVRAGEPAALAQAERAKVAAVVVGSLEEDTLRVMRGDSPRELDPRAALLLYTSGSSGEPKGVLLSADGLAANLEAILAYLPLSPRSRTPLLLPLVYSYSLVGQAFATLRAGGTLLGLGDLHYPAEQLAALARLSADGLSSVPTALRGLAQVAVELPQAERPALTYVASAGAPLDTATAQLLSEAFPGARRYNQYGLTEASPRVSAISDAEPPFFAGSVGRPLPGTEARVGKEGELEVRGPSVMLGYLDDPEGTARVLADGWLRTGDLGRIDESGYLYVSGRSDGLVKVAGERVSTDEIAALLRHCDGVAEVCVVAASDPALGARLTAFLEPREGAPEDLAARVRAFARERLPPAKRPVKVVELERLPRGDRGKIDRQALRRMVDPT